MRKMGYEPGLVRYTSERELEGGKTHWLRPRIIGYVTVLCLMAGVFAYNIVTRTPLEMTVMRDRNSLFVETLDGGVENIYRIHIVNMDTRPHDFALTVERSGGCGNPRGYPLPHFEGSEDREITLRVYGPRDVLEAPSADLIFELIAEDMPSLRAASESRFLKPVDRQ